VGQAVAGASSRFDLPWRFVVFQDAAPSAFSVPGGFVFLSTGLLKAVKDESELAGALGHEIAHVALAHGAAQLRGTAAPKPGDPARALDALVQEAYRNVRAPRARKQELQADVFGMGFAACAGYDPEGLSRLASRLQFEPAGADAPDPTARQAALKKARAQGGLPDGLRQDDRYRQDLLAKLP